MTELALLVKEYQLAGSDLRESMRGILASEMDLIRQKHGEAELQGIIRRVEATMNGARFPSTRPRAAAPPIAERVPKDVSVHGDRRIDDYFWMRERSDPKVIDYLGAENAYTQAMTAQLRPLQERIYSEILSHIKETDLSVPYRKGDWFYYTRTEEGKQYPIYCRRRGGADTPEAVVLDVNVLAAGHDFMSIGAFSVSDDGTLLAYSTDTTGYRQYTLVIKDLASGELFPERIERTGSVTWAADNRTLYYTTEDATSKRSDRFWQHVSGTAGSALLYEETDDLFDVYAYRSRDGAYVFLVSQSKKSSEVRYLRAQGASGDLSLIAPRREDFEYYPEHREGCFYLRTNNAGAKNFRIVSVSSQAPSEANWSEAVAHDPAVKIEDFDIFRDAMVIDERSGGLQRLRVIDLQSGEAHQIAFPEPAYALQPAANYVFDTHVFRYNYQSLVTPSSVYDYDMRTRKHTLLKETEVPGGFRREHYASQRIVIAARDGTQIPVSLVYRTGTALTGTAPMLLYAYGSYGYSIDPTFSPARLVLLDRGAVFAIAHIRGGGELGEEWRDAGRMMHKMNTFTDFIDVADALVAKRYAARERLVISGASAGGLLMGAVANLRPDLCKLVVAKVPFVDVLNTMLDAGLPLTTGEYNEWGNPNEAAAYAYMRSYSPYDNVSAQAYPAMLVETSLNDSQVPYWEAAKWVAKVRAMKSDDNIMLLKTHMEAGHGGKSGRYDAIKEAAFDYAVMLAQMGISE